MTHPENVQNILDRIRLRLEQAQDGTISLRGLEVCLRSYADELLRSDEE